MCSRMCPSHDLPSPFDTRLDHTGAVRVQGRGDVHTVTRVLCHAPSPPSPPRPPPSPRPAVPPAWWLVPPPPPPAGSMVEGDTERPRSAVDEASMTKVFAKEVRCATVLAPHFQELRGGFVGGGPPKPQTFACDALGLQHTLWDLLPLT